MKSKTYELVKRLYKNEAGKPFELTESQVKLFDLIFKKKHPRNHIMTFTQYGKTDVVAMAILTRITTFPEKFAIVAPKKEKARIMMRYLISHIFDNPYTTKRLEIGEGESLDRIRRERSKNRLTFKCDDGIGEVFILSAESHRTKQVEEALMGYGAPAVVEDESALIPDKSHSTVMRMLGGHKENFLVKIGNPFNRNHFLRSFNNSKYHQLVVDYKQGIQEGRITKEFIDEMRDEAMFDILYECKFPPEDRIDEAGWMSLFSEQEIKGAMQGGSHFGQERLGADVADTGENESVLVKRSYGYAEIRFRSRKVDTMQFAGQTIQEVENCSSRRIYGDRVGVGAGYISRLEEVNRQQLKKSEKFTVIGVQAGKKAADQDKFKNKRAEMYWRARQWLRGGGKLSNDEKWLQLLDIKYKTDSRGRIRIMPKEKMLKEGIASPDVADAFVNTFFDPETARALSDEERQFRRDMAKKKKKRSKKSGYSLRMTR